MTIRFIFIIASFIFFSCTSSRIVKPLNEKEKEIGLSIGGPMIYFSDISIPIPLTSLHYAYGYNNELSLYGGLHTTSLLSGVIHTDFGIVQNIIDEDNFYFGASVNPGLHFMIDTWEGNPKLFPTVDLNVYRTYSDKGNFFYFGATNWFDLVKFRAHDELNTTKWLVSPQLGHTFVRNNWNINLEVKYLVPYISNQDIVVDYVKWTGNYGTIGIYLGFNYRFNK